MRTWNLAAATVATAGVIAATAAADPSPNATVSAPGPNWRAYNSLYDANRFDVGGFPATSEFGNNLNPITQTLVASVNVPSSALGGNAAFGVAGYGMSSSTSVGSVGIFGQGSVNASGVSDWAANLVISNCGLHPTSCATNTGFNANVLYGLEIDTNISKFSGGGPNSALRGIYFNGASEVQPTNAIVAAIDVDAMGTTVSPKIAWKDGLRLDDGAAVNAINIGATGAGNNVGAMPIVMSSRDSGGSVHVGMLRLSRTSDLALSGPSGGDAQINSNGNCAIAALPTTDTAGCPLSVTGSVSASTFLHVTPTTVLGLSTADPSPSLGDLAFVSDAAACAFGSAVTGGGATKCPVYFDGTWKAG
jgi:hypothetical protein